METLVIGRIYRYKRDGSLVRIFRWGGAGFWSGRGCTPETAVPDNHIRATDVVRADMTEVNFFLEEEMTHGMAKTANINLIPSLGDWVKEVSSGYDGFRCRKCAHWIYADREMRCECDGKTDGL